MRTKFLSACLCSVVLPALGAVAGDTSEMNARTAPGHSTPSAALVSAAQTEAGAPWIHPSMPGSVQDRLRTAFAIAVARVTAVPECADLFSQLGADAVETLKTGLYFPASPARETSVCRGSMAQTYVGDAPTWICRRVTLFSS